MAATRKLTFSDEFNGPLSLRTGARGTAGNTWKTSFYGDHRTLWGNQELQYYVDPDFKGRSSTSLGINPFSISNGVLKISARPVDAADKPYLYGMNYTSGLLTTQTSFQQKYGYFEIRADTPSGQGLWPAFWMLAPAKWPPEIDIFEQIGSRPGEILQVAHSSVAPKSFKMTNSGVDMTKDFHTYGVEWTAQNLTFFIDGKQTLKTPTPGDMHQPMYLLVNLAVGGKWPGSPNATTNWSKADLLVDYVRAYSLGSAPATPAPTPQPPPGPAPAPTLGKITLSQGMNPTDRIGAVNVALGGANTAMTYSVPPAPGSRNGGSVSAAFDGERDLTLVNRSAWNAVKNALISHAPGSVTVRNFVDVELAAGGRADRIDLAGVKRGTIATGDGNDTITIAGKSNTATQNLTKVLAGNGDDQVSFTAGALSNARLDGGAGNDRLTLAGAAKGTMLGGLGNDVLAERSTGMVTLSGGAGTDTFSFTRGGKATVTDFARGVDRIQLVGVTSGQVRAAITGADTVLSLGGDSSVRLAGVHLTQPQLNLQFA